MRRAGQNPTELEMQDMINHIDELNTGTLDFPVFYRLVKKKSRELDPENHFKDAFRAFSKDSGGAFSLNFHKLHFRTCRLLKTRQKLCFPFL